MATHSSVFAWRIPGTGEPGGLPSVGSHRVGHDWETSLSLSLMGGAILSKSLIQFSVDGWGCVPSLLFDLRPNYVEVMKIIHHEKFWAGWSTSGIKIARRIINNLRYADDTTLMAESKFSSVQSLSGIFITCTIVWSEQSPTHQKKIGLKIYWEWPHPSEQGSISPSVSLSHQEASISLLSLSIIQ